MCPSTAAELKSGNKCWNRPRRGQDGPWALYTEFGKPIVFIGIFVLENSKNFVTFRKRHQ